MHSIRCRLKNASPTGHFKTPDNRTAAFRRLQQHLMEDRPDAQNIDMMNLAGFCRNSLSKWYQEAANARGIDMDEDAGREAFYGMPFSEWKAKHQTEASDVAKATFAETHPKD